MNRPSKKIKCRCGVFFSVSDLLKQNIVGFCSSECRDAAANQRAMIKKNKKFFHRNRARQQKKKNNAVRQNFRSKESSEKYRLSAETFYKSPEWLRLRLKILVVHGHRCASCGNTAQNTTLHVDHIKPRLTHPELELDENNLQVLCKDCNLGKGASFTFDFRNSSIK
jgi:5-methylcytosine-specific restriction endonuclease McrA